MAPARVAGNVTTSGGVHGEPRGRRFFRGSIKEGVYTIGGITGKPSQDVHQEDRNLK